MTEKMDAAFAASIFYCLWLRFLPWAATAARAAPAATNTAMAGVRLEESPVWGGLAGGWVGGV